MTKNHILGLLFLGLLLVQGSYLMGRDVQEWSLGTLVGAVIPALVVTETNELRKDTGAPDLIYSALLQDSAQAKAEDMANNKYFAHTSPSGVTAWEWFKRENYNYLYAGENLAVHYNESADVVRAWLQSKTHRETMLSGKYSEIGIGVSEGYFEGRNTVFVVEHFGTPLPQPAAPTIEVYSGVSNAIALATAEVSSSDDIPGALPFVLFALTTLSGLFYSIRAFTHAWRHEYAGGLAHSSFVVISIGVVYATALF